MGTDPKDTHTTDADEPRVPPHEPTPAEADDEQRRVDEEAAQSFPSSDPPAEGGPGI